MPRPLSRLAGKHDGEGNARPALVSARGGLPGGTMASSTRQQLQPPTFGCTARRTVRVALLLAGLCGCGGKSGSDFHVTLTTGGVSMATRQGFSAVAGVDAIISGDPGTNVYVSAIADYPVIDHSELQIWDGTHATLSL